MHIVHIIGAFMTGGAERFVTELSAEQFRLGHRTTVLALTNKTDATGRSWTHELEREGVEILNSPYRRLCPGVAHWLARYRRSEPCAVINVHMHYSEMAYAASRLFSPRQGNTLRIVHSAAPPSRWLEKASLRTSGIVRSITCSQAVHAVYSSILSGEVACIPNGISTNFPFRDVSSRISRLKDLDCDPHETHFISIGSMRGESIETSDKAHDTLIHAWRSTEGSRKSRRLHIFGDGELRNDIETLAKGDSSISFHGISPSVRQWLLAADIFVMPSRSEGLPISGIEAACAGIPCIFSDIPPLRELDYELAAYCRVDSPSTLARQIERHTDIRLSLPKESQIVYRRRFGIESTAKRYTEFYRSTFPYLVDLSCP
jgi:glycosyltransferase involved in cell wall biosynthesis